MTSEFFILLVNNVLYVRLNFLSQIFENFDESKEVISLLQQELAGRTGECHDLRLRLEIMDAVTTAILSSHKQMKDHFVKVRLLGCWKTVFSFHSTKCVCLTSALQNI